MQKLKRGDVVNALWSMVKLITGGARLSLVRERYPAHYLVGGRHVHQPTGSGGAYLVPDWVPGVLHLPTNPPDTRDRPHIHRVITDTVIGASKIGRQNGEWSKHGIPLHRTKGMEGGACLEICVFERGDLLWEDVSFARMATIFHNKTQTAFNDQSYSHQSAAAFYIGQDGECVGGIPTCHRGPGHSFGVYKVPARVSLRRRSGELSHGIQVTLGGVHTAVVGAEAVSAISSAFPEGLDENIIIPGEKRSDGERNCIVLPPNIAKRTWTSLTSAGIACEMARGNIDPELIDATARSLAIGIEIFPYGAPTAVNGDALPITREDAEKQRILENDFRLSGETTIP